MCRFQLGMVTVHRFLIIDHPRKQTVCRSIVKRNVRTQIDQSRNHDKEYDTGTDCLKKITLKDIYNMPAEKEDSIGDDRINITQMWLTRKDYLNIECQFMSSENTEKKHMLSLVINEASTDGNDNPDYLTLEFRHNANEDSPLVPSSAIVSYKLDAIAPLLEGKKGVTIRVNTIYEGEKFYQIDFKSAEESTTSRSGHTPSSDLIR